MRKPHIRLSLALSCLLLSFALTHCGGPSVPAAGDDPFPSATPALAGMDEEALEALASFIGSLVEEERIVGGELLVIKNRRTVLHRAFGWTDREQGIPMNVGTIFNVRSMTKPFTGAAAQLLIEQGELAPNDRVSEFLEGFSAPRASKITVEHLMTHRSGLPLSILEGLDDFPNLAAMAEAIGRTGCEFEPGSRFHYSDAGTDVLGALVSEISGARLDRFVTEEILAPLGMTDSFYYVDATADDPRRERLAPLYIAMADGFTKFWEPDEPLYPFAWGSQTLYSTPKDYARFLAMWLDGGSWQGQSVLQPESVEAMLEPVSTARAMGGGMDAPTGFLDLSMFYGRMSISYVDGEGQTVVIGHSGSDGTAAWAWPEDDLMILFFTQSRGGTVWMLIESEIDRLLFHPEIEEMNARAANSYAPLIGTYVDASVAHPLSQAEIAAFNGGLAWIMPSGDLFELEATDPPSRWRFKILPTQRVTFSLDEAGSVERCHVAGPIATSTLIRGQALAPTLLSLDEVSDLLGTYLDEEGDRKIVVSFADGILSVKVPELPAPLELLAPDEDGWRPMALNPTVKLRFDRNEHGDVISFTAQSPDGIDVRRRIKDHQDATPDEGGD